MINKLSSSHSRILQTIRDKKITRKDLAEIVNLTPASITKIINNLIEKKVIIETGEQVPTRKAGRRKHLIRINKEFGFLFGIAIETNCITITLANLYKETIASVSKTIYKLTVIELINYLTKAIEQLIIENSITKDKVLGVGVAIVGIVDSNTGFSIHAFGIWNHQVAITDLLEDRLGLPVVLDNNVRALALAELEAQDYSKDLLFIKYGPRIGSSLIIENEIYSGNSSQALEFGHIIVEKNGLQCSCGQKGCLETVGSFVSIKKQLELRFSETTVLKSICNNDLSNLNQESILEAFNQKDKVVMDEIEHALNYFSLALINLVKILDTKIVVLYGPFFANDAIFQLLINLIEDAGINLIERIRRSALNKDKSIGAISLARMKFFYNINNK